ncbi:MAG TPA: hypothetical protein VES02_18530 [Dermatophilaceae bacterium]|nr:hypothetical protein [Dermatophilaceae bacterium]
MSSVVNPVGPEEPSTYWRRRAGAIVGLLIVLWLGWWLLQAAFGSNDEPPAATPSASPSFGLTMSPAPGDEASEGDADPSAAPSASAPAASASPSPSASVGCVDSDIAVSASTAGATTTVGGGMALTLTVTNTGSAPCNRDVGAGANELRITSGSVLVWSSDFCNPSKEIDVQALVPGTPFTTSVTWPGTVTVESCPANQPQAQAGGYQVVARNGAIESDPVAFAVQ